jgi:hypothetical protein
VGNVNPKSHFAWIVGLFIAVAVLGAAGVTLASEHVINIPALSLVASNASTTYERNQSNWGNLTDADGLFYAPVNFPRVGGRSICSLSVFVRDFDDPLNVTVRLFRKNPAAGAFDPATLLATVSSNGFDEAVRTFTTTTISPAPLNGGFFYFVEVELPQFNNMQLLGIRITHLPTC